jgi:elongation of very long chain fatty acids protein 4
MPKDAVARKERESGGDAESKEIPPMRLMPTLVSVALCLGFHFWLLLEYWRVTDPATPGGPYHGLAMWPTFAAVAGYLVAVYVGPQVMSSFAPWDRAVSEFVVVYNFYQALLNAWIVYGLWSEVLQRGWPWWGQEFGRLEGWGVVDADRSWNRMAFFIYAHFIDKFVEFVDTAVMILRKKNDQLNFLHVTHHAMMGPAWLVVVHFACGGEAWWGSMMNSLVHVVMYTYYGLRALGIPFPWKRAVTDMQMVQFVLVSIQSAYEAYLTLVVQRPVYPLWLAFVQLFVMITMLLMFSSFYTKTYSKKPKAAADAPAASEERTKVE